MKRRVAEFLRGAAITHALSSQFRAEWLRDLANRLDPDGAKRPVSETGK